MKLVNPTDDVLDERFAIAVAGWKRTKTKDAGDPSWNTGTDCISQGSGFAYRVPRYTKSADLVLPWLEKSKLVDVVFGVGIWSVIVNANNQADCKSFPRAAVIALLRAHGIEVEFT